MRKALFTLFVAFLGLNAGAIAPPDSSKNLIERAKMQAWLTEGKTLLYADDYRGALAKFREINQLDPANANAELYYGQCLYYLESYPFALQHLETAKKLDPEVSYDYHYFKGASLHKMEKFDEALASYKKYKEVAKPSDADYYDVDTLISQTNYAKSKYASPKSVEVLPIEGEINSRFREYGAIFSPDGNKIYLTARKSSTMGGARNITGDNEWFEDIYVSTWIEEDEEWGEPDNDIGRVNTDGFESISHLHLEEDGDLLAFVTVNVGEDKFSTSSDIATAKIDENGAIARARLIKEDKKKSINNNFFNGSATCNKTLTEMIFVSEGLKTQGGSDLYISKSENGKSWGVPTMLPAHINSAYSETTPHLSHDGKYLFFSSKGHENLGGYDIFICKREGDSWSAPKNLGYPFNTVNHDTHFNLSPDGTKALLASIRSDGKGGQDIYIVDVASYDWEQYFTE
jgi:hypothetical protein